MNMFIAIALAAIAIGAIGYFIFFRKKTAASAPSSPVPSDGWTIQYSKNVPAEMTQASDGTYFVDLPSQDDGLHYVVENASGKGLAIGKTLTMTYSVTGSGNVRSVQGDTPGWVTPYMQRAGDDLTAKGAMQQYRYWGHPSSGLTVGDYTVSVPITADKWSDVLGAYGTEYPNGFSDCVANALVIGFTFGDPGQGATGHGCYVKDGTARFTLKSFTIA